MSTNASSGSVIYKWFRELRFGHWPTSPAPTLPAKPNFLCRFESCNHSDGKGYRRKKRRDYRRHSFNDRRTTPPPTRRRTRTNGFDRPAKPHYSARRTEVTPPCTMMPSRSTPNLRDQSSSEVNAASKTHTSTFYYVQQPSPNRHNSNVTRDDSSPPPAPPVRDSSTLKSIKYGPGHEKFPSWPVPAAAETPQALRTPPSGGSHRSKSWTDHTNYPKEKVVTYTRPYMKRQHLNYTQQKLKTVMERCEKIPPETYESRYDKMAERLYLPHVDRDGKSLGDMEYMVPSPPERDIMSSKPQLTQADLEEYARSYQDPVKYSYEDSIKAGLTKSGLEEFMEYHSDSYGDSLFSSINSKHDESGLLSHLHQKQLSYAQSEGYHSYVSSTDSTSTPFLDRLRRDSEAVPTRSHSSATWDDISVSEQDNLRREGRDSVVTTSSGSASSSETLKWHGSLSDVSVASSSCTHLANSSNSSMSRQLIAHSARVQTPQRHHSESVLYIGGENREGWKDRESRNNNANKLKLFPVNTYTVQDSDRHSSPNSNSNSNRLSISLQSALSVADRISELEKQQKYSYLDPDKKHKVPDPTLKAIQKKALLSFYERHHNSHQNKSNSWRSEPQLAQNKQTLSAAIPQPPPRIKVQLPSRRASSASDYASGNNSKRSSLASNRESKTTDHIHKSSANTVKHQHSNSCGSLSADLLGPVIMGPSILVDDYIPQKPPERPPKNPHLRAAFPDLFQDQRVPSPDLPPPSPPTVLEDEVLHCDDPLPPPPPECETDWQQEFNDRLKENTTTNQFPAPQVQKSPVKLDGGASLHQTIGLPERFTGVRSSIKTQTSDHIIHQVSSKPYNGSAEKPPKPLDFTYQRGYAERSSTRYPSTHKLVLNGSVAVSQKVVNGLSDPYRAEPLRPQLSKPVPLPIESRSAQRSSIAEMSSKHSPPPLQPRQMRVNQSMRARISHGHEHRPGGVNRRSPPKEERLREIRAQSMSQSKASYLSTHKNKDRLVVDSDTGSYKRTMSPNGRALTSESMAETQKLNTRETVWPLNRNNKDTIKHSTNSNILRRASLKEKPIRSSSLQETCDEKEDLKKVNLVLPDVLPVNAKLFNARSQQQQQFNRPTQLSLKPLEFSHDKVIKPPLKSPVNTPPSSPPKSPPRGSPFTPLKATNLSSTPISSPIRISPKNTSVSPIKTFANSSTSISPPSPKRTSPQIKPSLTSTSPIKLTSRLSITSTSSSGSSPLHTSPLSTPPSSPKTSQTPVELSPRSSPEKPDECPKVIEGLQMIQRTEVILRVNTSTTDASSQTEKDELPPTPLPTRKKLQEEIDCEKLSEDFLNHLPTSDRLKDLLVPGPDHKKPTDYVHGLFRVDITSRPRPNTSPFRSRNSTPSSSPPLTLSTAISTKISSTSTPSVLPLIEPTSPLSGTSTYFTTSEPKAKFLTRFSQDMSQCHVVKDTKDLSQKKEELVNRLDRKLEVLRSEQLVVSEECRINDELGENVETQINRLARPQEASKFRLHIEEVGKITSLLLGLSGRLARAENALMGMPDDHPERRILENKRDKLLDQLEEAKKLKECIDKRSISVSNILYKYLNSEQYADYDHYINMKAKLIMDSKEIADKIKLGEEQLFALKETLIVTD